MNALMFFLIAHLILATFSGVAEGGGGVTVTKLTQSMSSTDTSANVLSTSGFLKKDYIVIGDEYIKYTDKDDTTFLALERGWSDTTPKSYAVGTKVYSSNSDPLNAALGFSVLSTGETVGSVNLLNFAGRFLTTTLPRFVTWDYGILQEGIMTYVRTLLQIIGGAFIIYLALNMVGAFGRAK